MTASTRRTALVRLIAASLESSDHSVSNHIPLSQPVSGVYWIGLTGPHDGGHPLGAVRHLGFAVRSQARHNGLPNRVHECYGLIVHLRLLSTPPHGDAVTFGYRVPEHPGKDFHLTGSMQLQAHERGRPGRILAGETPALPGPSRPHSGGRDARAPRSLEDAFLARDDPAR
jgi:hypothetical protein